MINSPHTAQAPSWRHWLLTEQAHLSLQLGKCGLRALPCPRITPLGASQGVLLGRPARFAAACTRRLHRLVGAAAPEDHFAPLLAQDVPR